MSRKLILVASVASLMLLGASTVAWAAFPEAAQGEQQARSVTGTVTSIADGGRSFAMEVNQGGSQQTMQFVVTEQTVVAGRVAAGDQARVEYRSEGGQNVAMNVTPQPSPQR